MPHKISFSEEADQQLRELGRYIADKKSVRVALRYIAALTKACDALATFPSAAPNEIVSFPVCERWDFVGE